MTCPPGIKRLKVTTADLRVPGAPPQHDVTPVVDVDEGGSRHHIVLVVLTSGQHLKLQARAYKGIGKEHTKCGAGLAAAWGAGNTGRPGSHRGQVEPDGGHGL